MSPDASLDRCGHLHADIKVVAIDPSLDYYGR